MPDSLWVDGDGALLVDGFGAPIWCGECPCPQTVELPCGVDAGVSYLVPASGSGNIEVLIDWSNACTEFNGTYLLPTDSAGGWSGSVVFDPPGSLGSLWIVFGGHGASFEGDPDLCDRNASVTLAYGFFGATTITFRQEDSTPGVIDLTQWQSLPFSSATAGATCKPSPLPTSLSYRIVG